MTQHRQQGFTIIEVMLFLAISGMLLLVAFAFTQSSIRNARFTDATKTFEAFIQEQYTRVQTGSISMAMPTNKKPACSDVNSVASSPLQNNGGSSDTCLLVGIALNIPAGSQQVQIYPVLGNAKSAADASMDDATSLAAMNPRIWADIGTSETYNLPWGATISSAKLLYMQSSVSGLWYGNVQSLIFIRGVHSGTIAIYTYENQITASTKIDTIIAADAGQASSNHRNVPTMICIRSGDAGSRFGAITITANGKQKSISIGAISSTQVTASEGLLKGLSPNGPQNTNGIFCS